MELKPVFPMPTNINQTNYYWFQEGLNSEDLTNLDKFDSEFKNLYLNKMNLSIKGNAL